MTNTQWETTTISNIDDLKNTLYTLRKRSWITRGQSQCWGTLCPKIDREPYKSKLPKRGNTIDFELLSIRKFQSIAKPFTLESELQELEYDLNTLMVLQHFGLPTRFLDWSIDPYVAAYFSACQFPDSDCELWAFDNSKYYEQGDKQWQYFTNLNSPVTTTKLYAIAIEKSQPERDFFVCIQDHLYHHRIQAQRGIFSLTAFYGKDHADSLCELINDKDYYHRYIIRADLKNELLTYLKSNHRIEHSTIYPDIIGAIDYVKSELNKIL